MSISPFILKLKFLLQECPNDIAFFNELTNTFDIFDMESFKLHVKEYYSSSFDTFLRQLNFYGFKKTVMTNIVSLSHPLLSKDYNQIDFIKKSNKEVKKRTKNNIILFVREHLKTNTLTLQTFDDFLNSSINNNDNNNNDNINNDNNNDIHIKNDIHINNDDIINYND